jgi:hypothetical protein
MVILSPAVNLSSLSVCILEILFVFAVIWIRKLELSRPSTLMSNKFFFLVIKKSCYNNIRFEFQIQRIQFINFLGNDFYIIIQIYNHLYKKIDA